jgi:DNA-binding CsgD family transcriptional regulator
MKKTLVTRRKGKSYAKDILMLKPSELKPLTNSRSIRIIQLLSNGPMYPAQIAKKLNMYIQKVYYYINKLEKEGIVEIKKEEIIKGGKAKFYGLNYGAFGIEVGDDEREITELKMMDEGLTNFFSPMIKNNVFDGKIVVGSPNPHGPFNTGSRDGHYAVQLAFFMGQYMQPKDFPVRLDIDVKAEKGMRENMVIIGGPGVNIISYDCNKKFPYFFNVQSSKYGFLMGGIVSKKTKEVYTDDNVGVIQKIPNPWDSSKSIIMIAGKKAIGTKSGIIALTRGHGKLLSNYSGGEFGLLIRGLDLDGDGKVDSVEVIED